MCDNSILDTLKDSLNQQGRLAYYDSTHKELITRCPYCGDSVKNLRHGHLYISTHAPFAFFCHRCESKGYLNINTLKDFLTDLDEVAVKIDTVSRKAIKNTSKYEGINTSSNKKHLKLPSYNIDSKIYKRKLEYLENRLERNITIEELNALKVIMNYDDFLKINHLPNMLKYYKQDEYHMQLRRWLKVYSIGFLSMDGNYINFRHTKLPANNRRYQSESLNNPLNIGSRIYTISNNVDLFTPRLRLILTEGVMDIVSVWLNLYKGKQCSDTIFGSVNGRSYKAFIDTMRKYGFLDIDLEIYSDNDVNLQVYKYNLPMHYFNSVKIHYNVFKGEKDFGVPIERIDIRTYVLKK